jgi:hypothetical protein
VANRDFSKPLAGVDGELAFPGDIGIGARGMPAKRVQEWLSFHGQRPVIDGDFGPATERYVRVFQSSESLPQTGIVDATTWAKLTAPLYRAMRPIDGTGKTVNELVCLYARQHLAEKPVEIGGPNDGPWVRAYMLGNGGRIWQWCSGFSMHLLSQACQSAGVLMPLVPSFGVPQVVRSAKARARFSADGPASPGDLFVIPTASGSWSHIGIVLEWSGPVARFISAEGNTNEEGGSDGVCARSVLRNPARCDFIRVG